MKPMSFPGICWIEKVYGSRLSTQRVSRLCRDLFARLGLSAESRAVWSVISSNFDPSK